MAFFIVLRQNIQVSKNTSKLDDDLITEVRLKIYFKKDLVILIHKINTTVFEPKSTLNTYLFGVCKILWFEQLRLKKKMITSSS